MIADMEEGMSEANKALQLVRFLEELEINPEEVEEIVRHHSRSETTHGLLWGDIQNFGRETKGLKLIGLLCRILKEAEAWKADEQYNMAVVAANLKHAQEVT